MLPGNEPIRLNGTLSFGLLNFFSALEFATDDFLKKLAVDKKLQESTLARYRKLKNTARS
jgi:hypothetical protein